MCEDRELLVEKNPGIWVTVSFLNSKSRIAGTYQQFGVTNGHIVSDSLGFGRLRTQEIFQEFHSQVF